MDCSRFEYREAVWGHQEHRRTLLRQASAMAERPAEPRCRRRRRCHTAGVCVERRAAARAAALLVAAVLR